jgi:hypothetical protein
MISTGTSIAILKQTPYDVYLDGRINFFSGHSSVSWLLLALRLENCFLLMITSVKLKPVYVFFKSMVDPIPTRGELCFEIVKSFLSFGYLMYDTFQTVPPLPGEERGQGVEERQHFWSFEITIAMVSTVFPLRIGIVELFILYMTYSRTQTAQEVPTPSLGDGRGV